MGALNKWSRCMVGVYMSFQIIENKERQFQISL